MVSMCIAICYGNSKDRSNYLILAFTSCASCVLPQWSCQRHLDPRAIHISISVQHEENRLTVEVSPKESSSPARILRRIRLMIFPDRVFGKSSTIKTAFGAANGPIDRRTWRIKSLRVWSVSLPSFRATKALTAWPVSSSLTPTTAASATEAGKG